ncbi:MAG: hypothetical protein F9K16_02630 [Thermoanaerobaculia bacterium]|nr:MAG: hypothetical protein F9K16_02630 [Thermoanaerobaculia bacterium]MBZ0100745.1 hypothetical protein [Thermoanaerobaculia bacterium]
MTRIDPRAYAVSMLRRDMYREPTERRVQIWVDWFEVSGAFAQLETVELEGGADAEAAEISDDIGET